MDLAFELCQQYIYIYVLITTNYIVIQFGRWSFLLLGVTYGATRHSYLQKKEDKTKETRHQKIAEREARIAAEKKKFAEGDYSFLLTNIISYNNKKNQVYNVSTTKIVLLNPTKYCVGQSL